MSIKVITLGTAASIPSRDRENASILVKAGSELLLVDCPGSVVQKIRKAGFSPWNIHTVILTHDHVDHIFGLSSLVFVNMRRTKPIFIYGPAQCLKTARNMLDSFGLRDTRIYPRCRFIPVPMKEGAEIIKPREITILSTPVEHSRDTLGIRVQAKGSSFVYSSDTRRCERVAGLARGCDALFHDCYTVHSQMGDAFSNHSSARQAGEIAHLAQTKRLYLIHIDASKPLNTKALLREARASFEGKVYVPKDLQRIEI